MPEIETYVALRNLLDRVRPFRARFKLAPMDNDAIAEAIQAIANATITPKEAAELTDTPSSTIRMWCDNGTIRAKKVRNSWLIYISSLEERFDNVPINKVIEHRKQKEIELAAARELAERKRAEKKAAEEKAKEEAVIKGDDHLDDKEKIQLREAFTNQEKAMEGVMPIKLSAKLQAVVESGDSIIKTDDFDQSQ